MSPRIVNMLFCSHTIQQLPCLLAIRGAFSSQPSLLYQSGSYYANVSRANATLDLFGRPKQEEEHSRHEQFTLCLFTLTRKIQPLSVSPRNVDSSWFSCCFRGLFLAPLLLWPLRRWDSCALPPPSGAERAHLLLDCSTVQCSY